MEGEESLKKYSPEVMAQDPNNRNAVSLLPPTILFHGTADYSIPSVSRSDHQFRDYSSLSKLSTFIALKKITFPLK